MPQISFNPTNQCTLDDPTDGADLPSLAPNATPASAAPSTAAEPSCQAPDQSHGGAPNECTDALVRRFSAEGTGPTASEPKGGPWCPLQLAAAAVSCGKVVLEVIERQPVPITDIANCAVNVSAFGHCKTE